MTFLCSNLHIALLQLKSSLLYFRVLFVAVAKTGGSDDDGSNCCNLVMLRWPIFNSQLAREDFYFKLKLLFFNGISGLCNDLTLLYLSLCPVGPSFGAGAHCLKITQNVAFEFLNFVIFHQFLSY